MPVCLSVCVSCCVQAEELSDEVFAQRHLALEQKEKLRWSSWDKRKHRRRPTRWTLTQTHKCSNNEGVSSVMKNLR